MKAALAACAALLLALPASAEEPPVPRLFRGIAMDKGQWRMELLGGERDGRPVPGGMPAVTVCTDNLFKSQDKPGRGRADCKYRLLKDTADEAVMESDCPDGTGRVSMARESATSLLMHAEQKGKRGASSMKMRYTYEGACRVGQGAMSFDKESEACKQMRAQAANMDPAAACANAGAQRAQCEARMRAAAEQMGAMCR
jgi:hypothetical protein